MHSTTLLRVALLAGLAVATVLPASATILTFDIDDLTSGQLVSQDYGDRVTSADMGGFHYDVSNGTTGNVLVSYSSAGGNDLNFWTSGYSDLLNVIENESDGETGYNVSFFADSGVNVTLSSFDLGNWGGAVTLPGLSVSDGEGNVLWSMSDIDVPGSSDNHLHFDLGSSITASTLILHVDTTGMGGNSDNMGLDNIAFTQSGAVPEPATMAVLGLGAFGLMRKRRRN